MAESELDTVGARPDGPSPVDIGSGALGPEKLEDAPHVSGDAGVMLLGVREDVAATSLTSADGDYSPIAVTTRGNLRVEGATPHTGAYIGSPVLLGGYATDAPVADAAVGAAARIVVGRDGALFMRLRPRTPWSITHAPPAATQATISQASAGAALKNVMRGFMVSVIASGATTAETVIINIRDGATGAGTVLWSMAIEVPTLAAAGAVPGVPFDMTDLYLVGTAATAMTIEAAGAPGANIAIRVNAWGEVTG